MSPRGYLAIVGGHKIAAPWDDDLNSIIPSYSTNRDFSPYDMIGEIELRKLFSVAGRVRTAPRGHDMSVDRYVELLHARNGFSRQRMRPHSAAEFDGAVRDLVSPFADGDTLGLEMTTSITWGHPSYGTTG